MAESSSDNSTLTKPVPLMNSDAHYVQPEPVKYRTYLVISIIQKIGLVIWGERRFNKYLDMLKWEHIKYTSESKLPSRQLIVANKLNQLSQREKVIYHQLKKGSLLNDKNR